MTTSNASRRARLPVPDSVDVAVIGSGLGGLTAAAQLARRGLRVACFESHYVAGGCATQFVRGGKSDRYHFDVGLHYIGDCGPEGSIPRILRGVGVELDYEPMDPDGFDTLVFPDLEFRIPIDLEVYRGRLVTFFPHERRGIDRYVRILRRVMGVSRGVERGARSLGARAMASFALNMVGLARYQNQTIGAVLDDCVRDPKLRAVMLGQSGDYGVPPSEASAVLHFGLAGHYFRGAYYPKGGGQVIADRLTDVIEKHGGTVHLCADVAGVMIRDGRAVGVQIADKSGGPPREVRARAVLSNADIRTTFERLVGIEHLPASLVERVSRFSMAASLFITCLGVKADMRARGMRASNYWQFDSYDMEGFYVEARSGGRIASRGCYITSASLKDPSSALHHAPAGVTNIEVMTVVPGQSARWHVAEGEAYSHGYKASAQYEALKLEIEEQMIDRLDKLFPGTRSAVVFRESATPITHRRYTRATDGSGYGLAATPAQFLRNRPGYRTPIGGLYLAGASTRAGHGIVGAMMSGEQAALRIVRDGFAAVRA